MSFLATTSNGSTQDPTQIFLTPPRGIEGALCYSVRCRKETDGPALSAAGDVSQMSVPLKPGCVFTFSYDLMYSTTGVLCGAQFALTYSGTLLGGAYGINLTTIANGTVGDATASWGTFIGSGATVAGGGPRPCRLFGTIITGGSSGGMLTLRAQPTGVAATVSVLANSTGKVEEQ